MYYWFPITNYLAKYKVWVCFRKKWIWIITSASKWCHWLENI